jgi:hypothetical protein
MPPKRVTKINVYGAIQKIIRGNAASKKNPLNET